MAQTDLYCIVSGPFSGEKIPEIRSIGFMEKGGYMSPGWSFEEAREHLVGLLEEKLEELKTITKEEYMEQRV